MLETIRQRVNSLTQTSVIFRHPTDWVKPTHTGDSHLLYLVYQFKCQSHSETPSQVQLDQCISKYLASCGPVNLIYKIPVCYKDLKILQLGLSNSKHVLLPSIIYLYPSLPSNKILLFLSSQNLFKFRKNTIHSSGSFFFCLSSLFSNSHQ